MVPFAGVLIGACLFSVAAADSPSCSTGRHELAESDDTGLLQRRRTEVEGNDHVLATVADASKYRKKIKQLEDEILQLRLVAKDADARVASYFDSEGEEMSVDSIEGEGGDQAMAPDELYLREFTILAGAADDDVGLTKRAYRQLGYKKLVEILDNTTGAVDAAVTFQRGGICVVSFAASNDQTDGEQVLSGLLSEPVNFCGFKVHPGVVDELQGFIKAPGWKRLLKALNRGSCRSVHSVGHSLGASVATLFAACANRGRWPKLFGKRSNYNLVTFAPFAISVGEMYNGRPGRPFTGQRYGITQSNRGTNPLAALDRTKIVQFRISILTFFEPLLQAIGFGDVASIAAAKIAEYQNATVREVKADWPSVEAALAPHVPLLYALAVSPPQGLEAFSEALGVLVAQSAEAGLLFFQYDPVSSFSSAPYPYQHALQGFAPLRQPLKTPPRTVYGEFRAGERAALLPRADLFQATLAIFGYTSNVGGLAFPNHQLCCYSSNPICADKAFNVTFKACDDTPFR